MGMNESDFISKQDNPEAGVRIQTNSQCNGFGDYVKYPYLLVTSTGPLNYRISILGTTMSL